MKIDDNLSEVFDIEPAEPTKTEVISKTGEVIQPSDPTVKNDFEHSRNNLHSLLYQGQDALNHALEVAKSSEHPRAFEVVGNLIKQLAEINGQLMDLHQQKKKIEEPEKGEQPKTVNNNAIFVGSTTELNKLIQNMTKGD